jgi:tetratricopeptide (TPR) repeat protein
LYHHTAQAGNFEEARRLFKDRIDDPTYYQFGAYELQIELLRALFPYGEDKLPSLSNENSQASVLNDLALVYGSSGQQKPSISLLEKHNFLREKVSNKSNFAIGLGNLAIAQQFIGEIAKAENNLWRSLKLLTELQDDFQQAVTHVNLGDLLIYRSSWEDAKQQLDRALKKFDNPRSGVRAHWIGLTFSTYASRLLFMYRENPRKSLTKEIFENVNNAIKFMKEFSQENYPIEREHLRNNWLLGKAYITSNNLSQAEMHLSEALTRCRGNNTVEAEADILLDLARLRYAQKNYEEAKSLAEEALLITERCGYVLQGADVNLFLAQYALEQEQDKVKAKEYAEAARKLATCDGPPYYYKVAYEEAERFLENL